MKNKIIMMSVAALALGALTAIAAGNENAGQCGSGNPNCPIRQQFGGPGWSLTSEQKMQRAQAVQNYIKELENKQAQGTITPAEKQWLENIRNRNGLCINGVPRGPGGGAGFGKNAGGGIGGGRGKCYRWGCNAQVP